VFRVLMVCTGNICRSPLAEGILSHLLRDAEPPILVESAGVAAPEGTPASQHAVSVAAGHGIDVSRHRSRQLTRSLLGSQDLVLTMEEHHRRHVAAMAPSLGDRVHGLTDFVSEGPRGIADPLGCDRLIYEETFDRLEKLLLKAAPEILEMAREKDSQAAGRGEG